MAWTSTCGPARCWPCAATTARGKSTLVRILSGAQPPSAGTLHMDGRPLRLRSPADALQHGIATIHQDLALAPRLSVAENVFMGSELTRRDLAAAPAGPGADAP